MMQTSVVQSSVIHSGVGVETHFIQGYESVDDQYQDARKNQRLYSTKLCLLSNCLAMDFNGRSRRTASHYLDEMQSTMHLSKKNFGPPNNRELVETPGQPSI